MSLRSIYLIEFTLITTILAVSIYLQYVEGIVPCPLCALQRFAFIGLGIVFFMGIILARFFIARFVINILTILLAVTGMVLSGRQIWLQHFPSATSNECGVDLKYLMQALPLHEAMTMVFAGSTECTKRGWDFLYLNMAEWSLLWFLFFFLVSIFVTFKYFRHYE